MKLRSETTFYFVLSLLFGLQVHPKHVNGLHCYSCKRVEVTEHTCGYKRSDPMYGTKQCLDNEVCSKQLVYIMKNETVQNYIVKRCVQYNPQDLLNQCVHLPDASPPFSGIRCLCNDTDYCNGETGMKSKPSGWSEIFQLVCFVSVPIIINYIVLMIKLDFFTA